MTGVTRQSLSRSGPTGWSTELWRGDQKLAGDSLVRAEEVAKERTTRGILGHGHLQEGGGQGGQADRCPSGE